MRVLIADDQRDVGRALADLVRYCNHEVVAVVGSGLEAINAYSLHHPDLVLMDYRMPKLNGGTACRHIIAKDPEARVILVTAWSPSDEAGQSGAIAILAKPVALDRLNATLETVAQMLPAPASSEGPTHEVSFFQPDPIDYFPAVAEPSPVDPPSVEMPIPEVCYQPEAIDYRLTHSQFVDQPTPSSELQAPNFSPLPVDSPCLEMSFQIDSPPNHLQPSTEASVLDAKKVPVKPRRSSSRRHAPRPRAR